jgi:hypothetical protein
VTITGFTLDGDNPGLTSGVVRGGADIDARNGIITDHTVGVFNGLLVSNVTVKNIFFRAIYASSKGSFVFLNNTVTNVRGNQSSIAIFNFGGSGTIASNTVSEANDAIASNDSHGVSFLNNTIAHAGSGVHTDNAGRFGGAVDVIDGNVVSDCDVDGYGVWSFVPYIAPRLTHNTITNCSVGLGAFGQGGSGTTVFSGNVVDGATAVDSVGALATTDQLGYGTGDVTASFTGNRIARCATGLFVDEQGGAAAHVSASFNVIAGNEVGIAGAAALGVNAENTWWGCSAGPGGAGCDLATAFDVTPWLVNQLSVSPALVTPGATATLTANLTVNSDGVQPSGGTIPDGTPLDFASSPTALAFTPALGVTTSGLASATFAATAGSSVCARVPANVPTAALECVLPNLTP